MKKILLAVLLCSCLFASAQSPITWSMSMDVAANTFDNLHPRMATDANGNPVVIWGRMSDESVFIARWNGISFTMPVKINPAWMTIATQSWQGPDIASKGDTVYVVMKRTPEVSDTNHIYLMRSVDGGMSFAAPSQVDFIADSLSRFPAVTIEDNGNPVVGFMKFNSAFGEARWAVTKSSDMGNTFSTDVKASGWSGVGATVCDCCPGAMVHSSNYLAMLYRDNLMNVRDIWAGISFDDGASFSLGMPIDQNAWMIMSCPSSGPDGVIINDSLYTTYMSDATGDNLVYLSGSMPSIWGAQGVPITGMFTGLSSQNFPRIANAGNATAVAWKQHVNGMDQLALSFTYNITNGFPAAYDTVDMNNVTNTDIALTNGNIFVVWQDDNSGTVKFRKGTFSPTAIQESLNRNKEMEIFPNPANDYLTIQIPGSSGNVKISVTDVLGREILTQQNPSDQNNIQLKTSAWNNGIYFFNLQSNQINSTQKIIINHN